jgi:hypothetical protein
MTIDSAWSKKCFTILINEIVPRAKKLNMDLKEFLDPKIVHYLVQLEYQGYITRRELRTMLDERVKFINDSLQENTLEELPQHG